MSPVVIGLAVGLLLCVAGSAVLALAEVAIVRLRPSDLVGGEPGDKARNRQLHTLLDELPTVLNSVLLLVLMLQVAAGTIGGLLAARWLGGYGVTAGTILLTVLLFIYAEAIPKTVAVRAPVDTARRVLPIVKLVVTVMRPLVGLLLRVANLQSPGDIASPGVLREEELRSLTRESARAGAITEEDAELVDRSFEFNDRRVGDVMVMRSDISALEAAQSVVEAADLAISVGHRRLPVYGEGIDDIVGVVRLRDVAAVAKQEPLTAVSTVTSPVLRCGPGDLISSLLSEMQVSGRRLAIVGDAEGRTVGLVTVEDVVAELVGEIADDDPTRRPQRRPR